MEHFLLEPCYQMLETRREASSSHNTAIGHNKAIKVGEGLDNWEST